MSFTGTAGVAEPFYRAVGTGTDALVTVNLTGNERAARFVGLAISASGERRAVDGVGFMVPEEGWTVHAVGEGCSLVASGLTVSLAVDGEDGASWAGHLEIQFTQNYAAA